MSDLDIVVIGAGCLCDKNGSRPYPTESLRHVTDLASLALAPAMPYRAIWIAPGTPAHDLARDPTFWESRPGWRVFAASAKGAAFSYAGVRREREAQGEQWQREIAIWADVANRWGLPDDASPEIVYRSAIVYQWAMGIAPTYSPASTALALLKKLNDEKPKRGEWLRPLSADTLRDTEWAPKPPPGHVTTQPRTGRYIHAYDKNSAYMSACLSRSFGTGDPIEATAGQFTANGYGMWCISASPGDSPYNGDRYPSPFGRWQQVEEEWFYAPYIKAAQITGWDITIHHGVIWPETHRTLEDWAQALYTARSKTKARDPLASSMIKRSFTTSLGILSRIPSADETIRASTAWTHRPDWEGTIRGEHYLRQMIQIRQLEEKAPGYLAVATDGIFWISDDPDPSTAIPGILDRAENLGGYKYAGTVTGKAAQEILDRAHDGMMAAPLCELFGKALDEESD